jgi:Na+-driven multidrug efflux pump
MRVFFFYGCFGDSISQTAQTFLPATMYPVPNKKHSRSILKRLSAMAVVMGVVNSQVAVWILRTLGVYLTKDAAIVQMMRDHTGFFGLAILLHLVIMVAEGAVIASRDFWNLIKTYIITVCFHFGMLKFASGSFSAVWRTFFFFQLIRLVNFGYRVIKGHQKGYLS